MAWYKQNRDRLKREKRMVIETYRPPGTRVKRRHLGPRLKTCQICGNQFEVKHRDSAWCSKKCYQRHLYTKNRVAILARKKQWKKAHPEYAKREYAKALARGKEKRRQARESNTRFLICHCGTRLPSVIDGRIRSNIACQACRHQNSQYWFRHFNRLNRPSKQAIPCAECGSTFVPDPNQRYCGPECRKRGRYKIDRARRDAALAARLSIHRACAYCRGEFHSILPFQKFCSFKCKQRSTYAEHNRRNREGLTDLYCKRLLHRRSNLKFSDFTPELIQLKRQEQLAKRELKNLTK
jgi:hypothetical protein